MGEIEETIEIVKSGYGLTKGTTFNITDRVNLIVDENGTGKSTLLAGLANALGFTEDYRVSSYDDILTTTFKIPPNIGYFSELINKKHSPDFAVGDIFDVVQSMKASSGESTKGQISKLFKREIPVIILDEPCSHLDMYSVRFMAEIIKRSVTKIFFIVEHNKQFLDLMVEHNEEVTAFNVKGAKFNLSKYIDLQVTREIK